MTSQCSDLAGLFGASASAAPRVRRPRTIEIRTIGAAAGPAAGRQAGRPSSPGGGRKNPRGGRAEAERVERERNRGTFDALAGLAGGIGTGGVGSYNPPPVSSESGSTSLLASSMAPLPDGAMRPLVQEPPAARMQPPPSPPDHVSATRHQEV